MGDEDRGNQLRLLFEKRDLERPGILPEEAHAIREDLFLRTVDDLRDFAGSESLSEGPLIRLLLTDLVSGVNRKHSEDVLDFLATDDMRESKDELMKMFELLQPDENSHVLLPNRLLQIMRELGFPEDGLSSESEVEAVLQIADLNGDGVTDFEDYYSVMQRDIFP